MSIAGDIIKGAPNIASFSGFDTRDIYRFHKTRALPTFKVGRLICARKSELERRLSGEGGVGE